MNNASTSHLFGNLKLEVQNADECLSTDIPLDVLDPFATPPIRVSCQSDLSTRFVSVGVLYRIINNGISISNWHDQVMIHASLIDRGSGSELSHCQVSAFDISRSAPPRSFDVTKTARFDVAIPQSGDFNLTIKSKFAVWGLAGKYVVFAGGAQVYLNGGLHRTVKFEPTAERPYSENEHIVIAIPNS